MGLTLTEMQAVVNGGGSVMFHGQIITALADLPTAAEILVEEARLIAVRQEGKKEVGVLDTGVVNAGVATKQVLYTVPNGYKAVVTSLVARQPTGTVAQVETATVIGTIDPAGAGNVDVIVTAAGMNNSPKTISVAVANDDTAAIVAGKIRDDLEADVDVSAFFAVSGTGANIVLTRLVAAPNDATMNIDIDETGSTATGLTDAPTSTNTTAGLDLTGTVDFGANGAADDFAATVDLTALNSGTLNVQPLSAGNSELLDAGDEFGVVVGTPSAGVIFPVDVIGYLVVT